MVMDRKMAEIPQPIYVIKVRIVAWRGSVSSPLERSWKKTEQSHYRLDIP